MRFRPGLTIYQALAETGAVRFNNSGQIVSVSGVSVIGNVDYLLRLNGRQIPSTLLNFPVQPNDAVALELFYDNLRVSDSSQEDGTHSNEPC